MIPRDIDDTSLTPEQFMSTDFSKMKVGIKTLDDATIDFGNFKKMNPKYGNRAFILKAINNGDVAAMREISNFFYNTSGIYKRVCRYFAYLYKYDWFLTPYINGGAYFIQGDTEVKGRDKILQSFFKALKYVDDFEAKTFFGKAALKVIRQGCYYGYLITTPMGVSIQELPPAYCRSRYSVNGRAAVEFNMKFFDDLYPDSTQRARVLGLFPAEFKKGYKAFKDGKLVPDFQGDTSGWYLLDIKCCIKFNIDENDYPMFISAIPSIIDLDEAQELDKRRVAQKLLKILIQKMPIDKNGDLVFDVDEAQMLHNNAVRMLSKAIGIDVLTTFADVDVADMSDRSNSSQTDDLERVERGVYNDFGTPQSLFNSSSNNAMNNSIINDEASILSLVQQFESFLNLLIQPYNKNSKKCYYRVQILPTTIYNFKDMAKLYKEQTQIGYSKMLPQIALGQSQSSILATAFFESNLLDLVNVFIPPMSSNTMNAEVLAARKQSGSGANSSTQTSSDGAGRPELDDSEKSDKTLANRQSM